MGHCNLCPLATTTQIRGQGPLRPRLIAIGDHPTSDDERTGHPFSGGKVEGREYPGLIVPRVLEAIGISREDVYWAYALRCNNRRGKDVIQVKPAFLATCRSLHLEPELSEVDCPLILVSGFDAVKSVLPESEKSLMELRGRWLEVVIGGRKRLARVTFSGAFVSANSLYHAVQLPSGKLVSGNRWNPPGSCGWFFQKDIKAIRDKLKEIEE